MGLFAKERGAKEGECSDSAKMGRGKGKAKGKPALRTEKEHTDPAVNRPSLWPSCATFPGTQTPVEANFGSFTLSGEMSLLFMFWAEHGT